MPASNAPPVICLVGPTASGKTGVAEALARAPAGDTPAGTEVICCDAFSVYRGMEILTAAPPTNGPVPHHLVGILDPSETYSAARFVEDADRLLAYIRSRGRTPLVVGGTALYLRSWLQGFGAQVKRDEALRASLEARAAREGSAALHAALRQIDPARAEALHPNDLRRVIRALEINHLTGKPASAQRSQWDGPARIDAHVVCLQRTKPDLEDRIVRRTARMFDVGVVEEARALLARPMSPEARQVLGLRDLETLLEGAATPADTTVAETRAQIALRTRQLAKRQMTFFRSFPGIRMIDVEPDQDDERIAVLVRESIQEA